MNVELVPEGWVLAPDTGLRRVAGGKVLIGGSPLRILRLTETGAGLVDSWAAGEPVSATGPARRLARRLLNAGMMYPVVAPLSTTDVTVVIPVKDDAEGLQRVLSALSGVPVVVVDDGSSDPETIRSVALAAGAHVVRRPTSGGPGPARNTGLIEVITAFVMFVDADVHLEGNVIEILRGHFADRAVVAAAPRVRSQTGPTVRDRYEATHGPLDLGIRPTRVGPGRAVSYVPTAVLMVRVSALRALGGFDPALRFGEDVDAVWRLASEQGDVRYDPHVEVWHPARDSWVGWLIQRFNYGSSAAPLGERHGNAVAPARLSPWSAAAWAMVAGGQPIPGVAVVVASTAALVPKLDAVPDPGREALRLAGWGHLWAGHSLARAAWRAWSPGLLVLGLVSKRARRATLAAAIIPALVDWRAGNRDLNPVQVATLRAVDDLAYASGLWAGAIGSRSGRALLPDLIDWPGRKRHATEYDTDDPGGTR